MTKKAFLTGRKASGICGRPLDIASGHGTLDGGADFDFLASLDGD
jgi:hypothetical protein